MSSDVGLYAALEHVATRPEPYSSSTAEELWTSPEISEMLLRFHLDGEVDVASRRTDFIDASVDWMQGRFDLGPGRRVLDLGCGPGLYTNRLARTGASVTGIDFSARSIDHARRVAAEEGLASEHFLGDYLDWERVEPADLVLMIMCDYCALTPPQRERLLARLPSMMASGGVFLFDVYSMALFETWEENLAVGRDLMDGFWSARPYIGFLGTFRYDELSLALERYTIVEPDGVREYLNWFRHFDRAAIGAELAAGGLWVDEVLGDVAGAEFDAGAPEFAVIATA